MSQKLVNYDPVAHYKLIESWHARKGDAPVMEWMPIETTWLVEDETHGLVASGSLLLTNSSLCFMEHLVTDTDAKQMTQARALRFLALALEDIAKKAGFSVILGLVPEDHFSLAEFYLRQKALLGPKLMRLAFKYL